MRVRISCNLLTNHNGGTGMSPLSGLVPEYQDRLPPLGDMEMPAVLFNAHGFYTANDAVT